MRSARSVRLALALAALAGAAGAQAPPRSTPGGPFGFGGLGQSKEPITVTADNLEYDYKRNVVVYRGGVQVTQGNVKLVGDTLTITLESKQQDAAQKASDPPAGQPGNDAGRVQEIVAAGNVRIDQGERWAVGGRAVFDQTQRTLVLTENPVLHDGPSEVAGDRVVVFLDEDRSVVEGGQKRVKAVLYPGDAGTPASPPRPPRGATGSAARSAAREPR